MARYDKYEPHVGGFRAVSAVEIPVEQAFVPFAVGLDADGHIVLGEGVTGYVGVMIAHEAARIGDVLDVMTSGEIVEFNATDVQIADLAARPTAGKKFSTAASGKIVEGGSGDVGFTADAKGHLIVRFQRAAA